MAGNWHSHQVLTDSSKLLVRRANFADFTGVVNIDSGHAIYGGNDYVPKMFHELLQKRDTYSFVAEMDGVVIGYATLYIVENGTGVISCASRTKSSLRSKGLGLKFRMTILDLIKRNIPTLKWLRWTATVDQYTVNLSEKPRPLFAILEKWHFCVLRMDYQKATNLIRVFMDDSKLNDFRVSELNLGRVKDILSSEEQCRRLVPMGHIYTGCNWFPVRVPTDADVKTLTYDNTFCTVEGQRGGPVAGLGTICIYPAAGSTRGACRSYYHGASDPVCVLAFLLKVVRQALGICGCADEEFNVTMFFPIDTPTDDIYEPLKNLVGLHGEFAGLFQDNIFPD